jgi:hypothetical protein
MKKVAMMLCAVQVALVGCAGLTPQPAQNVQLANPQSITVIIPNDTMLDSSKIARVNFDNRWGGHKEKQEKINVISKTNNSFKVERRTDNGTAGSGVIFNVNYTVETSGGNTVVTYQPTDYRTYQQGLVLPFAVPIFTVQDLTEFIVSQPVYYNLEIDSQYNTESIYSNFIRLVERAKFRQGEKDPVTGKIFKDKFTIPYKDGKVSFSLETFPYRNGSKVVVHLVVPGSFTSENVVDFGIILKDIRTQLEGVANS